jgi:hypothetical protein
MKILKILLPLALSSAFYGCYTTSGTIPVSESQPDKSNLRLPYLSSVEMPDEITEGNALEVTVHGSWPDPSWVYYRTDYKISGPDIGYVGKPNEVEISLWGMQNQDAEGVITVLVDFTQTARVPDLKPGNYVVIIHGATEDIEKALTVKAKE